MDSPALALLIAGFGVLLIALGFQRQMQHAIWTGVSYGVIGTLMMLTGALMFANPTFKNSSFGDGFCGTGAGGVT